MRPGLAAENNETRSQTENENSRNYGRSDDSSGDDDGDDNDDGSSSDDGGASARATACHSGARTSSDPTTAVGYAGLFYNPLPNSQTIMRGGDDVPYNLPPK
jgi:hypothetical protein